jgi:hypothetical protein
MGNTSTRRVANMGLQAARHVDNAGEECIGRVETHCNLKSKIQANKLRSRLGKVKSDHENLRSRLQLDKEQDLINKSSLMTRV